MPTRRASFPTARGRQFVVEPLNDVVEVVDPIRGVLQAVVVHEVIAEARQHHPGGITYSVCGDLGNDRAARTTPRIGHFEYSRTGWLQNVEL